ncbi:MAG: SAM-dependent methyltransferase [Clostridia bacterium]|nr:SAM-dependent methyltransferase [Clostridia bacterium]MBQ8893223.1 SAM-dependent methyltransferase [Clostridia bacterium]
MSLLDSRLQTVLSLIPAGSILLDIGTDHCKLPAEGLRSGRLAGAYAADIKEGPLQAAKKQLAALGLSGKIPLYLSDGLKEIPPETLKQVTAVAVAGMGGEIIEVILDTAPAEPPLWVLQPMSAVYELLDALAQKGYAVTAGALARDGEKFYRVFAVQKTGIPYKADYFGMIRQDPLYFPFLEKEQRRVETALAGLCSAKAPDEGRIAEAEKLLDQIRKAMQ